MIFSSLHLFFDAADGEHVLRGIARLGCATAIGCLIGAERFMRGKVAGIRTHALVAIGAALFVFVSVEAAANFADASRVMQGVATGIGFLGGGAILKLTQEHTIEGLTTAASIWVTAAVGMAIGAGWLWPALLALAFSALALHFGHAVEMKIHPPKDPQP